MFADMGDSSTERKIRGIRNLNSRPVIRRIRRPSGVGAARGIEITVTVDDKAFEGSGVFLLGAILDQFFCEYAAINSFTQTVIRTVEWGEVMRWPASPRIEGQAMNYLAEVKQEPWRFDFFAVLRRLERSHPDQPRIGDSASLEMNMRCWDRTSS